MSILPFPHKDQDLHEGMGVVKRIVALRDYEDKGRDEHAIFNGQCGYCEYDRGLFETHTEVEGWALSCDHCGRRLAEGGPL